MLFRKKSLLITMIFLIVLIFSLSACNNDVDKAKEFMKAGMYAQAMELLETRISEKPTDAEAHFQLGICEIYSGNYSQADERFTSAVRLEPDYGFKIGEEYSQAGSTALDKGDIYRAKELFDKAIGYKSSLKEGVVAECLAKGKERLGGKEYDNADSYLNLVLSFQPDLINEIAELYYKASQKTDNQNDALQLIRKACEYNQKYQPELGKKLLEVGNAQGSPDQRSKYIDEASQYIDKETILNSSLAYFTELRGEQPKEIDPGIWGEALSRPKKGDEIFFLSLGEVWARDAGENEKDVVKWGSAVKKLSRRKYVNTKIKGALLLKSNSPIYVWINTDT